MDIELLMTSADNRLATEVAEDAKANGLEAAASNLFTQMASGKIPPIAIFSTLIRLAIKNETPRIKMTLEQVQTFLDVIGYSEFQIVGKEEKRGRYKEAEKSEEKLTWDRIFSMNEKDFKATTGIEKETAITEMEKLRKEE